MICRRFTRVLPEFYQSFTRVLPEFYQSFTRVLPEFYQWQIPDIKKPTVSGWFS